MLNRKVKDGVYKQKDGKRYLDQQFSEFAKEMTRIRRRLKGQHMIEIPDEPIMFPVTGETSPSEEPGDGGYRAKKRYEELSLDEPLVYPESAKSISQNSDSTSPTTALSNQCWLIETETKKRLEKGLNIKICVDEVPLSSESEFWEAGTTPTSCSQSSLSYSKGRLCFVSSLFL